MAISEHSMDILTEAERLGFHVSKVFLDGEPRWIWLRGADDRWPEFETKGAAVDWMEQRLRDATLFDR